MNENPINTSQVSEPTQTGVPVQLPTVRPNISERIALLLKEMLAKFYANKKMFWLAIGAATLVLLTLVAGLFFGGKKLTTKVSPSPSPQVPASREASASTDVLDNLQARLSDLRIQIDQFDVKQSKLQPPEINFKISF